MQRFFSELQRRKVLRIASGYVVGGWIILQVSLALQASMNLPPWFSTVIVSLLIIGLPIALVASWFLEITPEGIKRTVASGDGALVKPQTTDFILAGMLSLVLVVALVQAVTPREPTPVTAAQAPKPKPITGKSIAVLPFANMSPDKEDAYFADGLTEEILNALSQVQGLKVISRTSSFAFKGKAVSLADIAKQLSVRYVLEGSVRREADDVRITAQLIEVASDAHIWSKTFEPKLDQVFVAQGEIARAIALALEVEVDLAGGTQGAPTKNMEAYSLYLRGRELIRRNQQGDTPQAIELLTRAIELDPDFVQAHFSLAFRQMNMIVADPVRFREFIPEARKTAEAIYKLNPDFPGAIAFLAVIDMNELHWTEAMQKFNAVAKRAPSNALIHSVLGTANLRLGYLERAARGHAESRSLDPLNAPMMAPLYYGAFARGDDRVVLAMANKIVGTTSELAIYGHFLRASVAQRRGDHAEAERNFRSYMAARGSNKSVIEPVCRALKSSAAIPKGVLAIQEEQARDPSFRAVELLALIDPAGAMIDALQAELEQGDTYFVSFTLPSVWRVVVDHGANPKIKKLFRDTGLVDYWKKHGWPDRCRPKGEDDFECS